MRRDIEFQAGDVALRGWLYPAMTRRGPAPTVVMTHGFSATKEMGLDPFARVFAAAGLTVLVYDHRNLGASGGEPRQQIDPWAQARDYSRAIDHACQLAEVDPERIGIWGTSYSGGHVLCVGAIDSRVRAVVAQVPFAGLEESPPDPDGSRFAALRERLLHGDPARARAQHPPQRIAVVSEDPSQGPCVIPQRDGYEWFMKRGGQPNSGWRNEVLLALGGDVPYDPGLCVPHIAPRPLLMVIAEEDTVAPAPLALTAYRSAGTPKRLERIPGTHFVVYDGEPFQRAAGAARDFLLEHLSH